MQERPICFECEERIDYDPVFEAPCGHDKCISAVFHPLCLMRWREHRKEIESEMAKAYERWMEEHNEHDEGRGR